jgi:small-conductance mechanosensitive channel
MIKDLLQLDHVLLNNSTRDWLIALGFTLGIVLVTIVVKRWGISAMSKVARRTNSVLISAWVKVTQATKISLVTLVALDLGSDYLDLPHKLDLALERMAIVVAFLQLGIWLSALLDFWITRSRNQAMETNIAAATSLAPFSFLGRLILWTVMVLLVLDNMGVKVTALATSLGVGSIAVALAVQNILGDLFASLSIVIDRPFEIGDSISVDSMSGSVEHVGLKTTRLRSDTGEQIIISNGDLLKARLRNYKRMQQRCITFGFGVPFSTPASKLEKIPDLVRGVFEGRNKLRLDRVHFKAVGAYSHNFEAVYWVLDPSYGLYMDAQQAINLALVRAFEAEQIALAYPAQRLTVEGPVDVVGQATASGA